MKTLFIATTLLLWTVFSMSSPVDNQEEALNDFTIKGFTSRGKHELTQRRQLKTKGKGSKLLKEYKVFKEKKTKRSGKKGNERGVDLFSEDDGESNNERGVDLFSENDSGQQLQQLWDECQSREDKDCVFFANYQNTKDSLCSCLPKIVSEDKLEEGLVSIQGEELYSVQSFCSDFTYIAGKFFAAGGLVLNLFTSWASFGVSQGGGLAWAAVGSSLDGAELLRSLMCGDTPNEELIKLLEDIKEYVEEYTDALLEARSYKKALHWLNELDIRMNAWSSGAEPSLAKIKEFLVIIQQVQFHAIMAKMTGASLFAMMNVMYVQWATKAVMQTEREYCRNEISEHVAIIEKNLGLLDALKTEYVTLFFNREKLKFKASCNSGGCFCAFCGSSRLTVEIESTIEYYNGFQLKPKNTADYDTSWYKSDEYGYYRCYSSCTSRKESAEKELEDLTQLKWLKEVNKWWDAEIKDLYEQAHEILRNKEAFTKMCGQQCGPEVVPNSVAGKQSCECAHFPYCDLVQNRCVANSTDSGNDNYDCRTVGSRL